MRAVIVSLWPQSLPLWQQVKVGDVVKMHKGSRVCGHGTVLWTRPISLPVSDVEAAAVQAWLEESGDHPD